jgi:putative transposase
VDFKGSHFEKEITLWGIRWYVAYPMSYRQLEEMMRERGVAVDHSTLNRWVIMYAPELEKQFRLRKRQIRRQPALCRIPTALTSAVPYNFNSMAMLLAISRNIFLEIARTVYR